jgi:peptide/nickel transport system permease protein
MSNVTPDHPPRPFPAAPKPPAIAEAPAKGKPSSRGNLSQWQLIRLRFSKHRLAGFSLFILIFLYLVALAAEFFAPYPSAWRNLDFAHCPPQIPAFSFSDGLHVKGVERHIDAITFRSTYRTAPDHIVPLGFLVRGEPYTLWGFIKWDRRLLGVNLTGYERLHGSDRPAYPLGEPGTDPADVEETVIEAQPTFYFLGADKYGHDLFSRIIYGARISLSVGIIAIVITLILGVAIGGVSGYLGGATDNLIQRSIEIINAFPQLPLWLALAAIFPAHWSALAVYFAITIVLSLLSWTGLARVVRGKILSLREEDYAVAARLLGANHGRILFRHLVPGFTSHIIVTLTLAVPTMILGETALSFLGLGLRPPIVSWGVLLQDTMNMQAVAHSPWMLLPVLPIILTVLCFNFLGDGLRDAADPYSR